MCHLNGLELKIIIWKAEQFKENGSLKHDSHPECCTVDGGGSASNAWCHDRYIDFKLGNITSFPNFNYY